MATKTIKDILASIQDKSFSRVILKAPSSSGGKVYEVWTSDFKTYDLWFGSEKEYKGAGKNAFKKQFDLSDMMKKINEKLKGEYEIETLTLLSSKKAPPVPKEAPKKAEPVDVKVAMKTLFD